MKGIFFIILFLIGTTHLMAVDFNDKQKAIIYNEAIKTLKTYQELNNQMADAVIDMDEVNKTSQKMIDLFVNRKAIIYNDLDPNHKMSEVFELETYVTNLLLWYPDGMKISFDFNTLKAGNIINHGEDIYTVDLMASKTNNGNYLNRQKNELNEALLYRIAFFQKGNTFESFKIAGVRSSSSNLKNSDTHMLAEVKSVEFSAKEMQLIQEQTKALMNDYINFINLLSDPNETSEDKGYYKISFLGLFKDSTLKVANDIEPNPQNRWISVTEYQKNLVSSYPDGIKNLALNIDSAEYSKVIPEGKNRYYINGYIDKFFSGKFQNKTIYRDNAKYDFKVSFEKDENTFKNFKLASIDKFGVNLYEQNDSEVAPELPAKPISSLKRKGFYVGISTGAGKTLYSNPNLSNDATLAWNIQNKSALSFEANATWYFQSQLGAKIGLAYQRFGSATNLSGNFRYDSYFIDMNNEPYLKNITAAYDSVLTYNYLSIPIALVYHSNKNPETWGFYCEVGLVTSVLINANYQTTGDFSSAGYYEQYPEAMQTITDPKWGFITRTQIDEKGKADTKSLHFSATASCGISYPLDYFTTVYMGPEIVWGLSNIANYSEFTDAFGNKTTAQKVGISKYGIKFGINYKF